MEKLKYFSNVFSITLDFLSSTDNKNQKMKDKQFKELEKACNKLFQAHHINYRWLRQYGPNAFEDDGTLLAMIDGVERILDGREFILKTLIHFETKDEPVFYRWCATIKRVLDAYDTRFKTTAEEKVRSEERVLAFRHEERARKESLDKILTGGNS